MTKYIHGYKEKEQNRLIDQNRVLSKFIYEKIELSQVKHLLEIGCGVGAQMNYVLNRYPKIHCTGLDIAQAQISKAESNLASSNINKGRYSFLNDDILNESLSLEKFDGFLLVWVLEHIPNPINMLNAIREKAKKGAKIWITEVHHRRLHLYPEQSCIEKLWQKSIEYQKQIGGDANIGIRLGNLLHDAGFEHITIQPYNMFFDKTNQDQRMIMLNYWEELLESAVDTLLQNGITTSAEWSQAQREFKALKENENAVFCYSFVQGFATVGKDH